MCLLDTLKAPYHTAGFVCEVLICANYVSCCKLTHFNSVVTLAFSFQLTARVTVPCFWFFILHLCTNTSKERHFCFAAWPKRPQGCDGCVNHVHDNIPFATLLQCSQLSHTSLYTWYPLITEFIVIMIRPQIQLHTPLHMTILQDHI